jgi:cytidylate kinase
MAKPTEKQKTDFLEFLTEGKAFYDSANKVGLDKGVFYRLCANDSDFDELVSRAQERGQNALIDDCRELADQADETNYNAIKLKIWERQWTAGRRAPRKYGDKIEQTHKGEVTTNVYVWGEDPAKPKVP